MRFIIMVVFGGLMGGFLASRGIQLNDPNYWFILMPSIIVFSILLELSKREQ